MIDLDAFPRVALGTWPTPLEDAPQLSAALGGPPVLIKRDDLNRCRDRQPSPRLPALSGPPRGSLTVEIRGKG